MLWFTIHEGEQMDTQETGSDMQMIFRSSKATVRRLTGLIFGTPPRMRASAGRRRNLVG